jgi:hypothetical protein
MHLAGYQNAFKLNEAETALGHAQRNICATALGALLCVFNHTILSHVVCATWFVLCYCVHAVDWLVLELHKL